MAVEWFYTANKHQMGPVSWEELKQLAESGLLKPNDMVWSDGMDEWVKAVKQRGLFTDDDGDAPAPKKSRRRDEESRPPPGKRSTLVDDDEDDDDRKRSRRDKAKSESSKVALKVGLIIGGVVLLLFVLGCGGFLLFYWGSGASTPEPGKAYTWTYPKNMKVGNSVQTNINFKNGQRYSINVAGNSNQGATNLDFIITRSSGQELTRVGGRGLNYQLSLTFPADDAYRVRVENRGPGIVSSYRVVFTPQ